MKNITFFSQDHDEVASFNIKEIIKKPKIISLTGCFNEHICSLLSNFCDFKHIWRVSIPMIAADHYKGRNIYNSEIDGLSDRLNYELTCAYKNNFIEKIDIVFIDVVSDFSNDFFTKDGAIISDITSKVQGEGRKWPEDFNISEWSRIDTSDISYVGLYIRSLEKVIKDRIFGDAIIVFFRRNLAKYRIDKNDYFVSTNDMIEKKYNNINMIYDVISNFNNIEILDLDINDYLTDDLAPYGGPAEFHVSDYYHILYI